MIAPRVRAVMRVQALTVKALRNGERGAGMGRLLVIVVVWAWITWCVVWGGCYGMDGAYPCLGRGATSLVGLKRGFVADPRP